MEWLDYLLRWAHVIAGISWIGSSFYFVWLDSHLSLPSPPNEKVEGEIWLVHSGGFYQVERRKIGPGEMPQTLHWFKWEAAFTFLTGISLLLVVYYLTGGALLLDPSSDMGIGKAAFFSFGTFAASWVVYDLICKKCSGFSAILLGLVLFTGVTFHFCRTLSGRAAFLHLGGLLGTLMVANVWMRILPAQKRMIRATELGQTPDFDNAKQAKRRSMHNSYLTLPVLFLMLSFHYPNTYGHAQNWLVVLLLFALGGLVRHGMIKKKEAGAVTFSMIPVVLAGLVLLTSPGCEKTQVESVSPPPTPPVSLTPTTAQPPTSQTSGVSLKGSANFTGTPKAPRPIALPAECRAINGQPTTEDSLVKNGKVQNVFVWIKNGLEGKSFPAPTSEVILDQKGCGYVPHVLGIQVGQTLKVLNSDPTLHNVHTMPKENPQLNRAMATKGMQFTTTFQKPEVMVKTKCDVHPWMAAYIGVVPHPFFAVSGADGNFEIKQVPPGRYTLEAWHETYGRKTAQVVVGTSGDVISNFTFTDGK